MVQMPLPQWDARIAPLLKRMEIDATWIAHYTKSILDTAEKLEAVPEWPSEAIVSVSEVRDELVGALQRLDAAILAYGMKDGVR